MKFEYSKVIPYSFEAVLSQYFDYEHIAHVHPDSLGEYRLLSSEGNLIVYEQIWPMDWLGRRKKSVVEHEFLPPGEMWFRFVSGRYKGVRVHSRLSPHPEGTLVEETHHLPLPDWTWLRKLVEKPALKKIDAIWEEDLVVDVCRDGWPGVPSHPSAAEDEVLREPVPSDSLDDLPAWEGNNSSELLTEIREGEARLFHRPGAEIAVFRIGGTLRALDNRCPHTGGPLYLGRVEDGTVVCPWHGARFDPKTGECLSGPCKNGLAVYEIRT